MHIHEQNNTDLACVLRKWVKPQTSIRLLAARCYGSKVEETMRLQLMEKAVMLCICRQLFFETELASWKVLFIAKLS